MSHLVLYDAGCGLCDHFVRFLLLVDGEDSLRFAALQGPIGTRILREAGRTPTERPTVIVVADYETESERRLERSDAGLFALASAGGIYRAVLALHLVPRFIRDAVYDLIARHRYRIFGRLEACPIPEGRTREKFLDLARPGAGRGDETDGGAKA
jgi:predicted DCC family thiol-disulfide oxidoreductase YuxK